MSLVTRITARLRRVGKRSEQDGSGSPLVQDHRPMGSTGDGYRDYEASLNRDRISGGPPMSGF